MEQQAIRSIPLVIELRISGSRFGSATDGWRFLVRASGGFGVPAASASPLTENEKVFDTVLVVSDRRVIDGQLQDAIDSFERTAGVVTTIKGDQGSKSAELVEALSGDKKIVVCTIQTFPFALQAVRDGHDDRVRSYTICNQIHLR